VAAVLANAAVGEGPAITASPPPGLLADGFLFGASFGAAMRLFAPPTEERGS
jgi:hypothetical protein